MAILQAARAYVLGMPLYLAKSWGLNRAIFYAAAKRGFRKVKYPKRAIREPSELVGKPILREKNVQFLGDEAAFTAEVNGRLYFTIGGKVQTERDFEKQIEARFGKFFPKVWEEAVNIVKEFNPEILLSQRGFFNEVYKPLRDELARKWSELVSEGSVS